MAEPGRLTGPTLRLILALALGLASVAFASVLVGGRVMRLFRDEVYFLHEAYAFRAGWLEAGALTSLPYDLYGKLLSVWLTKGEPASLWTAVVADTALQAICAALLVVLGLRLNPRRHWFDGLLIVAGVLFFFSLGRLAEHRPDYLAVTFFSVGFVGLLQAFFVASASSARRWSVLAGLLLTVSVAFSPRTLVVLGVSLPLLGVFFAFQYSLRRCFTCLLAGVLGCVLALLGLWWVADFSLPHAIWAVTGHMSETAWLTLFERFVPLSRRAFSGLMLAVLVLGLVWAFKATSRRARTVALAAAVIMAGQLLLIAIDDRIYHYAYGYALLAYLLILAAPGIERQESPQEGRLRFEGAFPLVVVLLFLTQLPPILASDRYLYQRNFNTDPRVDETMTPEELLHVMSTSAQLVAGIESRVLLCTKLPEARYVGQWHRSAICLRNGYEDIADGAQLTLYSRVNYPGRRQLRQLLRERGLPGGAQGVLLLPAAPGDETIILIK